MWFKNDPTKPVFFGIYPHYAMYALHRDDPRFSELLARLEQSKAKKIPIHLTWVFGAYGYRIWSVDLEK